MQLLLPILRLMLAMTQRLVAMLPLADPQGWPAPGTPGAKALDSFRAQLPSNTQTP
jgi:hypothetical protein